MKRSGQHAIINWLCEANQPALHFNRCTQVKEKIEYKGITDYHHKKRNSNICDFNLYNLIVYNFEEQLIFKIKPKYITPIVIVREPKNLIASRIKVGISKFNNIMWINHMNSGYYTIFFDEWFSNENYRIKIMNDLQLNFNEKGLNQVYNSGKSSFDKFKYDGKAQQMDVLNRWKGMRSEISKNYTPSYSQLWDQYYPKNIGKHKPIIRETKNRWF